MKKVERQLLIKQLILTHTIATQEELLGYLLDEGIHATQATISRDIKELNLIKTPDAKGGTKYTLYHNQPLSTDEKLKATLSDISLKFTQIEFMNVLTTIPGNAHVIGALLDQLEMDEIVGTVAGNDTIMILSATSEQAQQVHDYLSPYMNLEE